MKYGFIELDGHTKYLRSSFESAGLLIKQCKPEEVLCPNCGRKALYTWRHCARTDIVMAIECSRCDLNCVTSAPIDCLKELLSKLM